MERVATLGAKRAFWSGHLIRRLPARAVPVRIPPFGKLQARIIILAAARTIVGDGTARDFPCRIRSKGRLLPILRFNEPLQKHPGRLAPWCAFAACEIGTRTGEPAVAQNHSDGIVTRVEIRGDVVGIVNHRVIVIREGRSKLRIPHPSPVHIQVMQAKPAEPNRSACHVLRAWNRFLQIERRIRGVRSRILPELAHSLLDHLGRLPVRQVAGQPVEILTVNDLHRLETGKILATGHHPQFAHRDHELPCPRRVRDLARDRHANIAPAHSTHGKPLFLPARPRVVRGAAVGNEVTLASEVFVVRRLDEETLGKPEINVCIERSRNEHHLLERLSSQQIDLEPFGIIRGNGPHRLIAGLRTVIVK